MSYNELTNGTINYAIDGLITDPMEIHCIYRHQNCSNCSKPFLHHFFNASDTIPRQTFGTKSEPKVAPKTPGIKHAPGRSPRKFAKIHKTLSQHTLGDFTKNVLQNRCFQDLPTTLSSPQKNTPKINQKSMKYHPSDGLAK